jgi:hypothetical protein
MGKIYNINKPLNKDANPTIKTLGVTWNQPPKKIF